MRISAQSFYLDRQAVGNSAMAFVTGLSLYCSSVPTVNGNPSGITSPGFSVGICPMKGKSPDANALITASLVQVPYASVTEDDTAETPIAVTFSSPIDLLTDRSYAVMIFMEDEGYEFWSAKKGDALVGTTRTFGGTAGFKGSFYSMSNDGTWVGHTDEVLKFSVDLARFTSNSATYELHLNDMEFITHSSRAGSFMGGEPVFTNAAALAGTISVSNTSNAIVGTGTSFTSKFQANGYVVFGANSTVKAVRKVSSIANNTYMVVTEPSPVTNASATHYQAAVGFVFASDQTANALFLCNSSANSTVLFAAGNTVTGAYSGAQANVVSLDSLVVGEFMPEVMAAVPPGAKATLSYALAKNTGSTYAVSLLDEVSFENGKPVTVPYDAAVLSRSVEVVNANTMYQGKSAVFRVALSVPQVANSAWASPYLYADKLDVFNAKWMVNASDSGEEGFYGNAYCKHVTQKIPVTSSAPVEDLFVYLSAYRPSGTDVEVYARVRSSKDQGALSSKAWTKLQANTDTAAALSSVVKKDIVDLAFSLPPYPPSSYKANGTVTTTLSSAVVTGAGTSFGTEVQSGDVVKVYSPLNANAYVVSLVASVSNTTQLTLSDTIANTSLVGTGLVIDKVSQPRAAFRNPQNSGIGRYFDDSGATHDGFDSVQLKVVLLANTQAVVPEVRSISMAGVSA